MNRTFLIFLMIGTALLIAVIGDKPSPSMPGYMPWEVRVLSGGQTRVFGITLEKTRIQDANQILSSFPRTRLISIPVAGDGLYAVYDSLNLGGFLAQLALQYDVDPRHIEQVASEIPLNNQAGDVELPEQVQLDLLNSRVKRILYTPEVDYTGELILQHFGRPATQNTLDDGRQHWAYPDMGLDILVDDQGSEIFIYSPVSGDVTE